ncbi:hypothetical protein [Bradyrhizobium sp. Y36]|uniref:hypothetical protein n=1 Tax=Bradyrhizobium sp. Y36 TaxID=2035447 RepID=UPI001178536C|nr:hypothetical protein [Bradyrhizobium sp. Y36]
MKLDPRVCTTIVDRIMRAAGVNAGLYALPRIDDEYLSDIADTLAQDPWAKIMSQHRLPIPDTLRGIQRDYAFIGGGYDTPSERVGRPQSGLSLEATGRVAGVPERPADRDAVWPDKSSTFAERFGDWIAPLTGHASASTPLAYIPEHQLYLRSADKVPATRPEDVRILGRMPAEKSDRSVFNSGSAGAVPFIPPDASFPSSPGNDLAERYATWPSPSGGGVFAGFNQAPQRRSDTPDNEDWSAMWRRRIGLP